MIVLALGLLLRLSHPGTLFSLSSAQFSFLLFFMASGVAQAHVTSVILVLRQIVSVVGYHDGCEFARLRIQVKPAVDLRIDGLR